MAMRWIAMTALCGALAACCQAEAPERKVEAALPQAGDDSFRKAAAGLPETAETDGKARNVILFVGDGMGVSTITAARIHAGQKAGKDGESHILAMETLPEAGLVRTYSHDFQVSDSAATATAMLAGVRTRSGTLGVTADVFRGVCDGVEDAKARSLFALAETAGMKTGVITSARFTHATPAASYAQSPDRNWEQDSTLPAGAREQGCTDIASQFVNWPHGDGIDVAIGGGARAFLPEDLGGARTDGRNLADAWQAAGGERGVERTALTIADGPVSLAAIDNAPGQVLALLTQSHLPYEVDRPSDQPSLEKLTMAALDKLEGAEDGYLLMVESGRIDHAHHAGQAMRSLEETLAFDAAIAAALKRVDLTETLVIVTADHSHTLTISGYPKRGSPIGGFALKPDGSPQPALDGKPYFILGYANGPGAICADVRQGGDCGTRNPEERMAAEPKDRRQEALVPAPSETHSGEDVAAFAGGPGSALVRGPMDQPELFHVMARALGFTWEPVSTAEADNEAG